MKSTELLQFILASAIMCSLCSASFASLGDGVRSVESDRQALHQGRTSVSSKALFDVHVIQTDGATTREYVSKDGVVFGVSWRGIAEPDLSQLFGRYYKNYKEGEAHAVRAGRRSPLRVKNDGLVVEKGGRMRDVHGRAYVPDLLPSGVTAEDIQ